MATIPIPPEGALVADPKTGRLTEVYRRYLLAVEEAIPGTAAPANAEFWVSQSNSDLTAERNIGALSTGYVKITTALNIATPSTTATIPAGDLTPGGTLPALNGSNLTNLVAAYPVGSVYINGAVSTNPSTLLGFGTWSALGAGRVLVGLDSGDTDFDVVGETGGAKTVSSAGSNSAPTFTGSALGTHAHTAGTLVPSAHAGSAVANHASHTHSVTSNVTVDTHASHTHTYTEVPNHVHLLQLRGSTSGSDTTIASGLTAGNDTSSTNVGSTANPTGGVATGTTAGPNAALTHTANNPAVTSAGPDATLTHSVTQPNDHTMSGTSEAVSAGTPAGSVSAPTFTGSPTSVVQPYVVVYMWLRTA